jgi:hypothetical protein
MVKASYHKGYDRGKSLWTWKKVQQKLFNLKNTKKRFLKLTESWSLLANNQSTISGTGKMGRRENSIGNTWKFSQIH